MRDAIHEYLCLQPSGASSAELIDLVFSRAGSDAHLGTRLIHGLLDGDDRFVYDVERGRWRATIHQALAVSLASASFVVVDLETTGGRPDRGQSIIEIGAVKIAAGRVVDSFQSLINPKRTLPPFITRLTGITDGMLAEQPSIAAVLPKFRSFVSDSVLVAHNARFDKAFLDAAWRDVVNQPIANPFLCTLRLSRRLLPGVRKRSLDSLAAHYGVPSVDRHRALGDARMTAEVFFHFLEELPRRGVVQIGELLDFQGVASDGRRFFCALPRSVVAALPRRPGVYRFFAADGELLYIGKAVDLRQRVSSYLSNSKNHTRKTLEMIRRIRSVAVEETGSELEASLLEARLIRQEKPPFNVARKHLPRIAYLKVGLADPFPRLSLASRPARGRARYIGPFRGRAHAQQAHDALIRAFRLRTCTGRLQPARDFPPCLQGQIGRCVLPCNESVGVETYAGQVQSFLHFFDVDPQPKLDDLRRERDQLSEGMKFESAARVQRDMDFLRHLRGRQKQLNWVIEQHSFVVAQPSCVGGEALDVYFVVHGRLMERVRVEATADVREMVARVEQWRSMKPGALRPSDVDGTVILAAWLRDRHENDGYVIPLGAPSPNGDEREAEGTKAEDCDAGRLPEWATALLALVSSRSNDCASA